MKGIILGYSKRDMLDRLDKISDFAQIHEYMHQPIRTYSTGMLMRLAFATAIQSEPDILLIDEVDKASNNELFLSFLGLLRDKFLLAVDELDYTFHSVILVGVHDIKNLNCLVIKFGAGSRI